MLLEIGKETKVFMKNKKQHKKFKFYKTQYEVGPLYITYKYAYFY